MKALLVGAYGGEHAGDAAILGGVLMRLQKSHRLTGATVASLRPHRTLRWLSAIETPVPVDVCSTDGATCRAALRSADMLAIAGGPVMDLPRSLASHFRLAVHARAAGKPFVAEGIGWGPYRRRSSRFLATQLLRLATSVTARSHATATALHAAGVTATVTCDPAFDYLATRTTLTRVEEAERQSIDALLKGTAGKTILGVNLRPLWSKYATGGTQSVARTETQFHAAFANGLEETSARLDGALTVAFFPMNADQYGFSDLSVAYALRSMLSPSVDFRIWEQEPGVDAVIALLRRCSSVVAMRFHSAIFALSQGVPCVGVDYAIGRHGKVYDLFAERGLADRLLRVQDFDAASLALRLQAPTPEARA